MIKAFISHSSAQKDFAMDLVNKLGRDNCIIDCYDFRPAYKTLNEIYSNIESCTIFVLLISKESLSSRWVKKEIAKARKELNLKQYSQFCPYIIDKSVKLKDIPKWIREDDCYNLKYFITPEMLRIDIEQKFRRMIWNENPSIQARETTLVGRNQDIDTFETFLYSQKKKYIRSLIISGRNGVGKDAFARQCVIKMGYPKEYEPYRISLDVKDNIEDFIMHLNLYCKRYNNTTLMRLMKSSPSEKAKIAVSLLNTIYDSQAIIFVEDNMVCVLPNRDIPQWLGDILESSELNNQLGLIIKSCIAPNSYINTEYKSIACVNLSPLNRNDRKKLFYQYKQFFGDFDISDSDVEFFVGKLLQSPSQILSAVEACSTNGIQMAKRDIDKLIQIGDKKIRPLLDNFMKDQLSKELLVVLSQFEFISFDILNDIFEEQFFEIQKLISNMMVYGILTTFGPDESFIRLDHYFCDYIKRNSITIDNDLTLHVNDVIENRVSTSDITEDVSLYLYNVKKMIVKGHCDNNSFLIPSIVIKSLMDVYNSRNYTLILKICEKIQTDSQNYYADINREISYWKCLALCRLAQPQYHDAFWDEVVNIQGADNYFLKGFFFRNQGQYTQAASYYRKALRSYPTMQRAKREMVTVLQFQGKYDKAFDMARENYENDSENTYHIHAYFRCLAMKSKIDYQDMKMMEELMAKVRNSYSEKKEELYAAMNIEYSAYAKMDSVRNVLDIINAAEREYPNSLDVKRAANEYKLKKEIITKERFESEINKWRNTR